MTSLLEFRLHGYTFQHGATLSISHVSGSLNLFLRLFLATTGTSIQIILQGKGFTCQNDKSPTSKTVHCPDIYVQQTTITENVCENEYVMGEMPVRGKTQIVFCGLQMKLCRNTVAILIITIFQNIGELRYVMFRKNANQKKNSFCFLLVTCHNAFIILITI